MEQSILKSVKKALGIASSDTAFDLDILMHINTAFATLNQLGVGPEQGLAIEDDTTLWATFYGTDPRWSMVRTYVFLKVRSIFDPPQSGYAVEAVNNQLAELEGRMQIFRESQSWSNPNTDVIPPNTILDGGEP